MRYLVFYTPQLVVFGPFAEVRLSLVWTVNHSERETWPPGFGVRGLWCKLTLRFCHVLKFQTPGSLPLPAAIGIMTINQISTKTTSTQSSPYQHFRGKILRFLGERRIHQNTQFQVKNPIFPFPRPPPVERGNPLQTPSIPLQPSLQDPPMRPLSQYSSQIYVTALAQLHKYESQFSPGSPGGPGCPGGPRWPGCPCGPRDPTRPRAPGSPYPANIHTTINDTHHMQQLEQFGGSRNEEGIRWKLLNFDKVEITIYELLTWRLISKKSSKACWLAFVYFA